MNAETDTATTARRPRSRSAADPFTPPAPEQEPAAPAPVDISLISQLITQGESSAYATERTRTVCAALRADARLLENLLSRGRAKEQARERHESLQAQLATVAAQMAALEAEEEAEQAATVPSAPAPSDPRVEELAAGLAASPPLRRFLGFNDAVRTWALEQGHDVKAAGKIRNDVVAAWIAANTVEAALIAARLT